MDLENKYSESPPNSFNAYVKEGDKLVLYSNDPAELERKFEYNPELKEKVVISGNGLHEFLRLRLQCVNEDKDMDAAEKASVYKYVLSESLNNLFLNLEQGQDSRAQIDSSNEYIRSVIENYSDNMISLFESGLDYSNVNHCINITALMMNVYYKRDFIVEDVTRLYKLEKISISDCQKVLIFLDILGKQDPMLMAQSALYHDIGKIKQKELFDYKGSFNSEQREKMMMHPEDGIEVLKELGIKERFVLKAVRNHHRRNNGLGYPEIDTNWPVSQYDLFLGLLDSFEAMTSSVRGYRKALDISGALKKLTSEIESTRDNPIFPRYLWYILAYSIKKSL